MSLAETCDDITAIDNGTTPERVAEIASQSERHLSNAEQIVDAVQNSLSASAGSQRFMLWLLIDRLTKQHKLFCDAFRSKLIFLCTHYAPQKGSSEWADFITVLKGSLAISYGETMISLILLQLGEKGTGHNNSNANSGPSSSSGPAAQRGQQRKQQKNALTVHSKALRTTGAFSTKTVAVDRDTAHKHSLQVKTLDSQMAMSVASSYAPSKPVEILVPHMKRDSDAPQGHMKALPADHNEAYQEARRKRLREIMERSREEQDRKQEEELLKRVRQGAYGDDGALAQQQQQGAAAPSSISFGGSPYPDFSDIQMPLELPRDEFGVKRGNFPLGVRFIRDAVAACGGAIELDVLSHRIATLANREVVAEFGNVREFLLIHTPTFRIVNEDGHWIVRLTGQDGAEEMTWKSIQCPGCSKLVRGRNFARHLNCRQCITGQVALGLQGDAEGRGPLAELAYIAKRIITKRETWDDGDIDAMADALVRSAEVRRFRLASPRTFEPIMKAMRVVRDVWLQRKGATEMDEAEITVTDVSVGHLFGVFGQNIHRLPVAWIEIGDVIDMCHRFTESVLPPFNPPPRPADPRINLHNEYPGFLLCESEVDGEDDVSGDDDEFSDDEAPAFTFAPPVDVAESLFTAGFERDTKKLQHRMRTAPPMVLQRVLQGDRGSTQSDMYTSIYGAGGSKPPGQQQHRGGGGGAHHKGHGRNPKAV